MRPRPRGATGPTGVEGKRRLRIPARTPGGPRGGPRSHRCPLPSRPLPTARLRQGPDLVADKRWISPEDIVQSVLVELLHQLDRLPDDATEEDLWRFVYRLASYRVRDAGRNHRRLNGESALGSLRLHHNGHPRTGTVTREDYLQWLADLVDSLPPKYAEVVRLCAFEELTSAQAGLVLGVSADVVRKRYEQARRSLERRLSRTEARRGG